MEWRERIVIDPKVLAGKPTISGTRISVELLAAGWREEQVIQNYPLISKQDIRACLSYAGELLWEECVYPLTAQVDGWVVAAEQFGDDFPGNSPGGVPAGASSGNYITGQAMERSPQPQRAVIHCRGLLKEYFGGGIVPDMLRHKT